MLSESSSLEQSLSPRLLTALMFFSAPLWGPGQAEIWNKCQLQHRPSKLPLGSLGLPRTHDPRPSSLVPQSLGSYRRCVHAQSCLTLCSPTAAGLLCPWDSPSKNTGVGCHTLLQGIFPTQRWNPGLLCLLHCRQITKMTLRLLGSSLGSHWIYRKNRQPNSILFYLVYERGISLSLA